MTKLNDASYAAFCAASGFFAAKMDILPDYSRISSSIGLTLAFNAIINMHPNYRPMEESSITILAADIATLTFAWSLNYGLDLPDWFVHPLLIFIVFLLAAAAYIMNNNEYYTLEEMREIVQSEQINRGNHVRN